MQTHRQAAAPLIEPFVERGQEFFVGHDDRHQHHPPGASSYRP